MTEPRAYDLDIAPVAALLADPARAAMLAALLDGRSLAAGELARVAGVGAPTASAHLSKLLAGGMVVAVKQGRHRYYRLPGPETVQVIEVLGRIAPGVEVGGLRQSRRARRLRLARTCYDHLAGQAGVAVLAALLEHRFVEPLSTPRAGLAGARPGAPRDLGDRRGPGGAPGGVRVRARRAPRSE